MDNDDFDLAFFKELEQKQASEDESEVLPEDESPPKKKKKSSEQESEDESSPKKKKSSEKGSEDESPPKKKKKKSSEQELEKLPPKKPKPMSDAANFQQFINLVNKKYDRMCEDYNLLREDPKTKAVHPKKIFFEGELSKSAWMEICEQLKNNGGLTSDQSWKIRYKGAVLDELKTISPDGDEFMEHNKLHYMQLGWESKCQSKDFDDEDNIMKILENSHAVEIASLFVHPFSELENDDDSDLESIHGDKEYEDDDGEQKNGQEILQKWIQKSKEAKKKVTSKIKKASKK